jgi:hypothetical protein
MARRTSLCCIHRQSTRLRAATSWPTWLSSCRPPLTGSMHRTSCVRWRCLARASRLSGVADRNIRAEHILLRFNGSRYDAALGGLHAVCVGDKNDRLLHRCTCDGTSQAACSCQVITQVRLRLLAASQAGPSLTFDGRSLDPSSVFRHSGGPQLESARPPLGKRSPTADAVTATCSA